MKLQWQISSFRPYRSGEIRRSSERILDEGALHHVLGSVHGRQQATGEQQTRVRLGSNKCSIYNRYGYGDKKPLYRGTITMDKVAEPAPSLALTTSSPPN